METSDIYPGRQDASDRGLMVARARRKSTGMHRHFRRTLSVLVGAVLLAGGSVALLLGISWVRSEAAVGVVQAQVEALRNGEIEQAYALFSSEYQAGVSLPMFQRWLRRERRLSHVEHIEFWGRSVWGRTALLWGSFGDELGHSYSVRYLLIREKGSWRIDSLNLAEEIPERTPEKGRLLYI